MIQPSQTWYSSRSIASQIPKTSVPSVPTTTSTFAGCATRK